MINNKKVLALIPARGGSKGIKDKNIINLAGMPLIAHTINSAKKSKYIDSIVVSTDTKRIKKVAESFGARVPFMRPKKLATDKAKTVSAVVHAIKSLEDLGEKYDILLLLQATQPLRKSIDIDGALEMFIKNNSRSLISIGEVVNHPLHIRKIGDNNRLIKLVNKQSDLRRQEFDKNYCINGAIYINSVDEVNENTSFNDNELGYIMPRERLVDIDEYIDLVIAEALLLNYKDNDENR